MQTNHSHQVVVVGSINMDLVVTTPFIPAAGETVLGSSFTTHHGGKGANQAVAAARAGADANFVGRVGGDQFGETLRAGLVGEGVGVFSLGVCKHDPSGVALISVAENGENSIVVAPGANEKLRIEHIADAVALGVFHNAPVVLMQLEIPVQVVEHVLALASRAGCCTVLNSAPVCDLPDGVWNDVHVLIANETEIEQLGGVASVSERVPVLIVTSGAVGIEVHEGRQVTRIAALEVEALDTTGAGDTFCGYFAAELSKGAAATDAAALANIAAGMSVRSRGARTAPTADELSVFLDA